MINLITGVAGFVGSHLALKLLQQGHLVVGVDSLTDYYNVQLKTRRLAVLQHFNTFNFHRICITDLTNLIEICNTYRPNLIIHLAAQAGVVTDDSRLPYYIKDNIHGTETVSQLCTYLKIPLIYASSSSVYGDCSNIPFQEQEKKLTPVSFYAATKLHNEQFVAFCAKNFGLRAVGLRFFSIYGEDMRPDMAISKFTSAIYHQTPITLYGDEHTARDFTYIGDVVHAISIIAENILSVRQLAQIYNIGHQSSIPIVEILNILSRLLGKQTEILHLPLRAGEVQVTYSDTSRLHRDFNYFPDTPIEEGLEKYVQWYLGRI